MPPLDKPLPGAQAEPARSGTVASTPVALIGVISDTHGRLRERALEALVGCDHILHAGDIGSAAVLDALRAIAPVTAVRGNNDFGPWAEALPERVEIELAGLRIHMLHDIAQWRADALAAVQVVVFGHSHRPLVEVRAGVLYLNPGSAGPRRFTLPVTLARLRSVAGQAQVERIDLD